MLKSCCRLAIAFILACFGVPFSTLATAQEPRPPTAEQKSGEIVVAADGAIVAPWMEFKRCDLRKKCVQLIANPVTHEIARLDGHWSTRFGPTGVGEEVKRVESESSKAKRLSVGKAE